MMFEKSGRYISVPVMYMVHSIFGKEKAEIKIKVILNELRKTILPNTFKAFNRSIIIKLIQEGEKLLDNKTISEEELGDYLYDTEKTLKIFIGINADYPFVKMCLNKFYLNMIKRNLLKNIENSDSYELIHTINIKISLLDHILINYPYTYLDANISEEKISSANIGELLYIINTILLKLPEKDRKRFCTVAENEQEEKYRKIREKEKKKKKLKQDNYAKFGSIGF